MVAVPSVATTSWIPCRRQGDDVHVALDDQQARQFALGLLCFVQAVEFLALVKDRPFPASSGTSAPRRDDPAAETDDAAAAVADREHDPVAKAVVMAAAIPRDDQTGVEQLLALLGGVREIRAAARPSRPARSRCGKPCAVSPSRPRERR